MKFSKKTVEEYNDLLRAYITLHSWPHIMTETDRQELLSEAWVIIMRRNLPRPEWASIKPSTWLYNIAREVVGKQKNYRTRKKRTGKEIEYDDMVCMLYTQGLTGVEQNYYVAQVYKYLDDHYKNTSRKNVIRSDILKLVDEGYTNPEIATKMNLSKVSIEKQKKRIRELFCEID